MIPPKLQEALDLLLSEVVECIAAECILAGYAAHHEEIGQESAEAQRTWKFIEQALSWRLALAVNRLLQPANKDRASLLGFAREVKAAREVGFHLSDPDLFDRTMGAITALHALPEARDLKACRDGFMAHALIGSQRSGMKLEIVSRLSDKIENAVEELHLAITGLESPLHARYCDWRERSDPWWDKIFPEPR